MTRRLGFTVLPALFLILTSVPAFATNISVGYINIAADTPNEGEQQIQVFNLTGDANCSDAYSACSPLSFSDWTMTIFYNSSYYGTSGAPNPPAPLVLSGGSGSSIDPTVTDPSFTYDFDLCGGTGTCGAFPATTITSIEFKGSLTSGGALATSVCLYDVTNCAGQSSPTYIQINPAFDLLWNADSSTTPYVDQTTFFTQSPDITITNATDSSGGTVAPEPGTFWLSSLLALIPLARFIRSRSAA